MRPLLLYLVAAITFIADQTTKFWIVHGLRLDEVGAIDVFPPYLNFRMGWNRGVNFGLFSDGEHWMRWVLIGLALAIVAWVIWWMRKEAPGLKAEVAAGLLVGGALGNVIDRLIYGAVADFLNMTCCGINNPYTFNVADIAIFAGAIGLILFTGKPKNEEA